MTGIVVKVPGDDRTLQQGFEAIRERMGIPRSFSYEVEDEAAQAAARDVSRSPLHEDRLDLPFITIDPERSRDLDQAIHAIREESGYLVHYAIADVEWFVDGNGELDAESRRRGVTLYSPDIATPLYPRILSEGAASLLPQVVRPSVLWQIRTDLQGNVLSCTVGRALIRSRKQMSYREAQDEIDYGTAAETLQVVKELGELRLSLERRRGAVSLAVPEQEVTRCGDGFCLGMRELLPVERWNAQISLMTGMEAASKMLAGGVGILRSLPPPKAETVAMLRRAAAGLGIEWPEQTGYADLIRGLDPASPTGAALLTLARRLFRGVDYTFFEGRPPQGSEHSAIAGFYAHVTAPLRRLVDRFANRIVLAIENAEEVTTSARSDIEDMTTMMAAAKRRAQELERRSMSFVEALVMSGSVGDVFAATVLESREDGALVHLYPPPVIAECAGAGLDPGARIRVRVDRADPGSGTVGVVAI